MCLAPSSKDWNPFGQYGQRYNGTSDSALLIHHAYHYPTSPPRPTIVGAVHPLMSGDVYLLSGCLSSMPLKRMIEISVLVVEEEPHENSH